MQQVVRLLGDLGERYGAEHVYQNLRTPADAIKLLCINYPAFKTELIAAHESGIGYRVLQAGVDLNLHDLHLPIGQNDLIVTPVLVGQDGAGQILAGIGLIAASFFFPGAGLFGTTGLFGAGQVALGASTIGVLNAAAIGTALSAVGATMVLGGVTQMLSPQPELGGVGGVNTRSEFSATRPESVNRGFDGQQSYAYLGAQNTVGVGATIPVAYGRVLIGSHVISADVDVTDESDPLKKVTRAPGPDTVTVNGNKLEFGTRREGMARWNNVNFQKNYSRPSDDRILTIEKGDRHQMANQIRLEFTEGPTKSPDHYFVCIEIFNLFKFSSGPGSTKTDAFISYHIEAKNVETGNITARESFTIQGLVVGTYRYYHKFNPNKIAFKDFYKTRIQILDASIDSGSRMTFFHGFNPSFS
jgi:predicted phage tail protein